MQDCRWCWLFSQAVTRTQCQLCQASLLGRCTCSALTRAKRQPETLTATREDGPDEVCETERKEKEYMKRRKRKKERKERKRNNSNRSNKGKKTMITFCSTAGAQAKHRTRFEAYSAAYHTSSLLVYHSKVAGLSQRSCAKTGCGRGGFQWRAVQSFLHECGGKQLLRNTNHSRPCSSVLARMRTRT